MRVTWHGTGLGTSHELGGYPVATCLVRNLLIYASPYIVLNMPLSDTVNIRCDLCSNDCHNNCSGDQLQRRIVPCIHRVIVVQFFSSLIEAAVLLKTESILWGSSRIYQTHRLILIWKLWLVLIFFVLAVTNESFICVQSLGGSAISRLDNALCVAYSSLYLTTAAVRMDTRVLHARPTSSLSTATWWSNRSEYGSNLSVKPAFSCTCESNSQTVTRSRTAAKLFAVFVRTTNEASRPR